MAGKSATLMRQMADQVLRFVDGVRKEGGIRRVKFAFPDAPVVVVVLRESDFEQLSITEGGKGPHRYVPQVSVMEICGWCLLSKEHTSHIAP